VLYAAVAEGELLDEGEQLFLLGRTRHDEPAGLVAAPPVEGMLQRISPDGQLVEYVDINRNSVLLYADARKLQEGPESDEVLLEMLGDLYRRNHSYSKSGLYPRYYFPVEGVEAQFFTLDTLLTHSQIVQMNEAFALLNRPEFAPLKNAIFSQGTAVAIIEGSDIFLGRTYLGTGVMQLNRRDLLGNKYWLVSVLAHEGTHILQTRPTSGNACRNALRREVGNQQIPDDFFSWSAEQVVEAIPTMEIGAYHVGFWVLEKLGVLQTYVPTWRSILQTGKVENQWVSGACQ
jgi:hypothetical protein